MRNVFRRGVGFCYLDFQKASNLVNHRRFYHKVKLEKIDIGVLNRERAYLNVSMEQALFTAATTGSEGQSNVFLSLPT